MLPLARVVARLGIASLALAITFPLAAGEPGRGLNAAILVAPLDAAPDPDPASAAVLVGGINDTWLSLAGWVPIQVAARRQVFGYAYDQRVDDLQTSAGKLAEALSGLAERGVRRLHLVAYSMGGWVAKAALDRMAADGSIAAFESVELTTLGTPWGGFDRVNVAWRLRGFPTPALARAFSRLIAKPMAFEVGSRTPFVRARRAALAPHVTFRVFEGRCDEVARPRTATERENYEAVVALASERVTVAGARHRDMRGPDWRTEAGPSRCASLDAQRLREPAPSD